MKFNFIDIKVKFTNDDFIIFYLLILNYFLLIFTINEFFACMDLIFLYITLTNINSYI
ncbi:Hypothetical protein PAU_03335 [Photorhabdus asymbiotica]|uniref:Uncharacterized protein n=1 Tax=Photorhabdus asymbiotica subsp. asymbiotica (strain ATCC 43949 / 3105-77) TaxID=553480 RepID=B6VNM7_PHOAA|nr:Hypothetical protein PAU_03335 [Photorhabdus asymbiotica]CAR67757.1 Hypothetical protein PA-RVA20-21-0153 [Photorhabdus asymbiotica subsp. asymbiotica ATCC 43949]